MSYKFTLNETDNNISVYALSNEDLEEFREDLVMFEEFREDLVKFEEELLLQEKRRKYNKLNPKDRRKWRLREEREITIKFFSYQEGTNKQQKQRVTPTVVLRDGKLYLQVRVEENII